MGKNDFWPILAKIWGKLNKKGENNPKTIDLDDLYKTLKIFAEK